MNTWYLTGRLRDYPFTIGSLEQYLDDTGIPFDPEGSMWCESCERAFPVGSLRVMKSGPGWTYYEWALECATERCLGGRAGWHPWHPDELPRTIHPEYPDQPAPDARYPLSHPD